MILRVNGVRHQFGPRTEEFLSHSPTRSEVEEWTWRKYRELEKAAKREATGLPGTLAFSALLDQFRAEEMPVLAPGTRAAYEDTLKPVEEYFVEERGDPTLVRVHARDVRGYLSWRRVNRWNANAPLSNRTLAKDRAVLHRLFGFADRMEYREGNPVARVEAPKSDAHDPVILTDAQYNRLLDECRAYGPMLHLYAILLGEAGCRTYSEALRLRWEGRRPRGQVHLDRRCQRGPLSGGRVHGQGWKGTD